MVHIKLTKGRKIVGIAVAVLVMILLSIISMRTVTSEKEFVNNIRAESHISEIRSNNNGDSDQTTNTDSMPYGVNNSSDFISYGTDNETDLTVESDLSMSMTDAEATEISTNVRYYTEYDAIDIAKVLYHECRGIASKTEQACVVWTVLNRVDKFESTIYSVLRAPNQFAFYEDTPVWDELLDLANDVLNRWNREKNGEINVGRVLPCEYLYFEGRNGHNFFRDNYSDLYTVWDYSLESPYET